VDLLADLNEPQRQAVCHVDGPLLVLAGAGSGKTRVITRRVAYLISQGIPPGEILAITFTNKAAEEMRRRVLDLRVPPGATVSTFHSLGARLLRELAGPAGLSPNYSIYDRDDQLRVAKAAVEELDLRGGIAAADALAAISVAKNALKSPQTYAGEAETPFQQRVAEIYRRYEQLLAARNALDFDDLLLRTACLLRDRQDIRQNLGRRFRYVLIDEYQDINHAQYVIAHGIALEHHNLAVTGDPDQSIYAWRGADIGNILEFESDYPSAVVVRLEENYRSTAPILAAASRLIAHNTRRKHKELWTRRPGGQAVRVVRLDDERAEARYVASRVAELAQAGQDRGEIAVFYRVNALSRVLEEAMIRQGIPYRIARGVEFYNRKEIKDVCAYLRVLANGADDISCRRAINTPPRGIGQGTVNKLAQFASASASGRKLSLLDACRQADQAGLGSGPAKKVAAFVAVIDELAKDLDPPVGRIVEETVRRSGLAESLGADEEGRQAAANVGELVTAATEFDTTDGGSLVDFLGRISLVSDTDHFDGAGAVTLMTLHAAKGLEFDHVFLVGCEDGMLPFRRAGDELHGASWRAMDVEDLEEERRLAFVGMTRARSELVLTCVQRRMIHGRTESQTPSPFLADLDGPGVEAEDATTPVIEVTRLRRGAARRGGFYADVDERAAIEAIEAYEVVLAVPEEYEHLRPGCWVKSPHFGAGKVMQVKNPWPETRVIVDFAHHGRKTLVLKLAHLEMMNERD
jgi:DNA helicase-2/ATP-dependent DNA helicase PcrA